MNRWLVCAAVTGVISIQPNLRADTAIPLDLDYRLSSSSTVAHPPQDRLAKASAGLMAPSREYRIAPGDVIAVRVFGESDLSMDNVRVPSDGLISYPLLGQIRVSPHSVRSLERQIELLLGNGYLRKPKVSVSIIAYRPVFIRGGVNAPGAHEYAEELTVEKALALAGGLTAHGSADGITLLRNGSAPATVDLNDLVMPGDVISVPQQAQIEKAVEYVYLYGEIKNPGSYPYREGLTVEKAVALAGGFSQRASKRKIQISRDDRGGTPVRMKRVQLSEVVRPGDVVTVGASLF